MNNSRDADSLGTSGTTWGKAGCKEQLCACTNEHNLSLSKPMALQSMALAHKVQYTIKTISTCYFKKNADRSQISHTNTNGCTDADVLTRKSSSAKISAQLLLFQVSADPEQEHWGVTHVTHATCATLQKSRPSLSLSYFWSMNGAKMSAVLSLNLLLLKLAVWHQRKTFLLEILSIVL